MKNTSAWLRFSIAVLVLALVLGAYCPVSAKQKAGHSLDMVVKISKLEQGLKLIDELMLADPANPFGSPTFLLRGMLQGTEWIDPARLIVIGVNSKNAQPEQAVLIPFKQPNEQFRAAYNATAGPDYYVMSLPPGKGPAISKDTEASLVAASKAPAKAFVAVELAVAKLLIGAKGKVEEGLNKIQGTPGDQKPGTDTLTPQELKETLSSVLDTAGQLKTLELAVDLSKTKLSVSMAAEASQGTRLSKIFTRPAETSIVDGYAPKHHVNFRCRSSDFAALLELLDDSFGKIYGKMGVDFSKLATICKGFTGEVAGGMSYGKEGMKIEMISVLKDPKGAPDFLDKVYMPWLIKYGKDMAKTMESQLGKKVQPLHVRTPDTKVAGQKVVGVRAQAPFSFMPTGVSQPANMDQFMNYEMRMTTVGNLLLTAPDDRRIAGLIKVARKLKQRPSKGPFMTVDIDMTAYLGSMMEMMPAAAGTHRPLPQMGRVTTVVNLTDGGINANMSMKVDDIRAMVAHFKNKALIASAAAGVVKPAAVTLPEEKSKPQERKPKTAAQKEAPQEQEPSEAKEQEEAPTEDSAYWYEKGAICAVYGNDKGAVRYFKKAIELAPDSSDAHFSVGVSYGEIGDRDKALASINKAIELGDSKGLYLYGRGRVYLLSGEKDKAVEDFKQAASLGIRDAQGYLENNGNVQAQ